MVTVGENLRRLGVTSGRFSLFRFDFDQRAFDGRFVMKSLLSPSTNKLSVHTQCAYVWRPESLKKFFDFTAFCTCAMRGRLAIFNDF